MDDKEDMKKIFHEKLDEILSKKANNGHMLTKQKYLDFLDRVKRAQLKTSHKSPKDYHMLKHFTVINLDGEDRLAYPSSFDGGTNRIYVNTEEVFDILYETHVKVNHGGREKMVSDLQKYYKNVTQELVSVFLSLCQICKNKNRKSFVNQAKRSLTQSKRVAKPKTLENLSKYQIEIIDMSKEIDCGQKYIMVYRNMSSDYIQLRTLRNDDARDIVPVLLDIFTIFGVPCILYSTLGQDFLKEIITELHQEWPGIKIISGESPDFLSSITHRDILFDKIKSRLNDWKKANSTCNWSKGVRFVQLFKNKTPNKCLRTLPHDWVFRSNFSEGLKSMLNEIDLKNIHNEKDIENFINFENVGSGETAGDSFDDGDEPSEKLPKITGIQGGLDEFCNDLFNNELLEPESSDGIIFVKEEIDV